MNALACKQGVTLSWDYCSRAPAAALQAAARLHNVGVIRALQVVLQAVLQVHLQVFRPHLRGCLHGDARRSPVHDSYRYHDSQERNACKAFMLSARSCNLLLGAATRLIASLTAQLHPEVAHVHGRRQDNAHYHDSVRVVRRAWSFSSSRSTCSTRAMCSAWRRSSVSSSSARGGGLPPRLPSPPAPSSSRSACRASTLSPELTTTACYICKPGPMHRVLSI
jgi:hypothetical protein